MILTENESECKSYRIFVSSIEMMVLHHPNDLPNDLDLDLHLDLDLNLDLDFRHNDHWPNDSKPFQ